MEASGLNGASKFDDEKALKGLLEVFGPAFSLDQIASAYCKAGKNADDAAEALTLSAPNGEVKANGEEEEESSQLSRDDFSKKPYHSNGNSRASKAKYRPVSVGSVSSIIGKQYVRKAPSANGSCNAIATKPLKLDSKVLPISEIWGEQAELDSSRYDRLHQDVEDFLFSMLGDGFNLERDRIHQVLDSCGYDMEKSMENLINWQASTSDKRNELSAGLCLKSEVSSEKKCINSTEGDKASSTIGVVITQQQKERNDLQKEVLAALFSPSERPKERPERLPRKTTKAGNRYEAYGQLVVEPPKDLISEYKPAVVYQQHHGEDGMHPFLYVGKTSCPYYP